VFSQWTCSAKTFFKSILLSIFSFASVVPIVHRLFFQFIVVGAYVVVVVQLLNFSTRTATAAYNGKVCMAIIMHFDGQLRRAAAKRAGSNVGRCAAI
jgi:hypothetical protein